MPQGKRPIGTEVVGFCAVASMMVTSFLGRSENEGHRVRQGRADSRSPRAGKIYPVIDHKRGLARSMGRLSQVAPIRVAR